MKRTLFLLVTLCTTSFLFANPGEVEEWLFSYDGKKIYKSEFLYIYEKNNIGQAASYSEQSLREYLELYVNFKLKVREAEDEKLNEDQSIKDELQTYRKQLAKSYLADREVTANLIDEAYKRMQTEIRAKHILINVGQNAAAEDTLKAFTQAQELRKRAIAGEDFSTLAISYSQDPSAKDNGGDLGYFTAMQMVYPFESAAYNTKVGGISDVVRTRFGYHIIKVTDNRESRGKILASHIFVRTEPNDTEAKLKIKEEKINDIYTKLSSGSSFESLAKEFSDDKTSAAKGGKLPWFSTGKMVIDFEDVAFSLKNNGDISKPFKTQYGWHIVKRLDRTSTPSFEEMKDELKRKIEKDSRSEVSKKMFIQRIKKENNFLEFGKAKEKLWQKIDSSYLEGKWKASTAEKMNKTLFKIGEREISQFEFAKHLEKTQQVRKSGTASYWADIAYDAYVVDVVTQYEEDNLERKYPEFRALMGEYRDGILLFELTDRKVWSKAVKDTVGLKEYYEANREKYMWGNRLRGIIFNCANPNIAEKARELAEKNVSAKEIGEALNSDAQPTNIYFEKEQTYEKEQNLVVDQIIWKMGVSQNVVRGDGKIAFVKVTGLFDAEPKSLDEARGYIVADYQEHLEAVWLASLHKKYPVAVNEEVLATMVK